MLRRKAVFPLVSMKENGVETVAAVELAKKRCRGVIDRIESIPPSKITDSCKRTLLRLANSELHFLSRFTPYMLPSSSSLSINIGHIEAVIHIIQQPFITGVSRVCKPIPVSPATGSGRKKGSFPKGVHVDVVCNLSGTPVWFIVSDRNPRYVSWHGSHGNKGLRARIEQLLAAAQSFLMLKPSSVILFFSNGLEDSIFEKLERAFGASEVRVEFSLFNLDFSEEVEDDWINIFMRSYRAARVLEIKVDNFRDAVSQADCVVKGSLATEVDSEIAADHIEMTLGDAFCSLISRMKLCTLHVTAALSAKSEDLSSEGNLINFDTTALIALVSGISNRGTEKLLAASEGELRQRFKSNFEFVIAQVMSEIQSPILVELDGVISGKRAITCESVSTEFKELVSMCGGPKEKLRADQLLKCIKIVPDNPSARMMGLPTTRKLALKNKIVFGTGDYWRAPTLTANAAFVRAVSQTGMSLFTIQHRPQALTGD